MDVFKYEIGGKTFIQKKLVLGQVKQLRQVISKVNLTLADLGPSTIVTCLEERLPEFIAVILIEQGKSVMDRDLPELVTFLYENLEVDKGLEVLNHFFELNDPESLLNIVAELIGTFKTKIVGKTGSTKLLSFLAKETLPSETGSSGT